MVWFYGTSGYRTTSGHGGIWCVGLTIKLGNRYVFTNKGIANVIFTVVQQCVISHADQ